MDARERARSLEGIATDSTSRQRFAMAHTTSADHPVPSDVATAHAFCAMRQSVVTLLHQRPSTVERPGRSPAQCSAQRDRGAIGVAAAARLLQPLIWLRLPRSSRGISVTTEPRSRRRETATGRSNRRTRPESHLAEADVSRMRLAVLEVCARSRESPNDMRRIFGGSSRRRHIRPPSLRCRARAFCSHRAFRADAAKL